MLFQHVMRHLCVYLKLPCHLKEFFHVDSNIGPEIKKDKFKFNQISTKASILYTIESSFLFNNTAHSSFCVI